MRNQVSQGVADVVSGLAGVLAYTGSHPKEPTAADSAKDVEDFADARKRARALSGRELGQLALSARRDYPEAASAAELLASRLDNVNRDFVQRRGAGVYSGSGVSFEWVPIRRVGLYVPWRYPITAITYLSAARAAGVPEIVVYLAEDRRPQKERPICTVSALACERYGICEVVAGPARVAFLSLTFPTPALPSACDLLCGPANRGLNASKQICGLVGRVAVELYAGPSEFVAVCDATADWKQVALDLNAQREHGATSAAHLVLVGAQAAEAWSASGFEATLRFIEASMGSIEVHRVSSLEDAVSWVEDRAPETLELWVSDAEARAREFRSVGVLYVRSASSLGDYGAIGRGCADPTCGRARSQSGVSPQTFLRLRPIVSSGEASPADVVSAAAALAEYEGGQGFPLHARAIRGG